jgi:type I restriction enzyme S subunit
MIRKPPIEMQNDFAVLVEKVERLREKQGQSNKELDDLFNSLMHKAFRGELDIAETAS